MQIAAPPPAVADLSATQALRRVSNKPSMQKFQNSVPEDRVTLSEQAKRIQRHRQELNRQEKAMKHNVLKDLTTTEFLDQRRLNNQTVTTGIKLMYSDNINDEMVQDSRLIKDSIFEYAVSSARSLKADQMQSDGTGDSINLMVLKKQMPPSPDDLSISRQSFDMNDDYDSRRNLAKNEIANSSRAIDFERVENLGKNLDVRFQLHNRNKPTLPDANVAIAMKKYAQVPQNLEI